MEVLTAFAIGLSCVSFGALIAEWKIRSDVKLELDEAAVEMRKTVAEIAKVHNELATKVLAIQDQLSTHEMKLGGMGTKSKWMPAQGSV